MLSDAPEEWSTCPQCSQQLLPGLTSDAPHCDECAEQLTRELLAIVPLMIGG